MIFLIIPILLAFIRNYWLVFVLRLILGSAIGLCSCVSPLYVTETVKSKYRGRIGSLYQLFLCVGLALGYLTNLIFANGKYDITKPLAMWQWSVQYALGTIIGIGLLVTLYFADETDVWINKKIIQSKKTSILNDDYGKRRKSSVTSPETTKNDEITKKEKRKYYVIGTLIGILPQLAGINVVLVHCNTIFSKVGLDNTLLVTFLVTGLWNLFSVSIIMPFVDKIKRRTLMIVTHVGITIGNLLLAISFTADVSALAVVGIGMFLFMFECGPGCLFWVIASEIYPSCIRDRGMSLTVTLNSIANMTVTFLFPLLSEHIGSAICFYLLTGFSAFSTFFYLFYLPESSGELDQNLIEKEDKTDILYV